MSTIKRPGYTITDGHYTFDTPQIHAGSLLLTLCTSACTEDRHVGGGPAAGARAETTDFRKLLRQAIDSDDRAAVEGAAILAAGHGLRYTVTITNGHYADIKAERYDHGRKT